MKRLFVSLLVVPLLLNTARGTILRIGLNADLRNADSKTAIFGDELLISENDTLEIFTGPYTITLSFDEGEPWRYDFHADCYGLAPDHRIFNYDFSLEVGETSSFLGLPVKKGSDVDYAVALLDDSSGTVSEKFPPGDTSVWNVSETIHYRTHCVKGSLMDYKWDTIMRYLEFIYNKYRQSYRLSEFDKIETYIYPDRPNGIYLDSRSNYAIDPKSRRIDLVYGHDIKAATPAPACELLTYRLWGYGPRWMVEGFAHYYEDNLLRLRDIIGNYGKQEILNLLRDEGRVKTDTGSIVTGALVFWLLQNETFGKFKRFYTQSTVFDFESKFEDIYKYSFDNMLGRFVKFAREYSPSESELGYYASRYFNLGDMAQAGKYYGEQSLRKGTDRIPVLKKLATCDFWLGDYASADSVYDLLIRLGDGSPETLYMKGEVMLANGATDSAMVLYSESYKRGFATGRLRNISILIDTGKLDSAEVLLNNCSKKAENLLDYSIESARIKSIRGENADSLLDDVIIRATNDANKDPDDSRFYLILGKAYALERDYEKSMYQFNIAYFLENSQFYQAFILLEMGKTEDWLGHREKAKNLYRKVVKLGGGKYQMMLAERYLGTPYGKRK